MIEAIAIAGGLGLVLLFGSRRRRKRAASPDAPRIVPPVVIDPLPPRDGVDADAPAYGAPDTGHDDTDTGHVSPAFLRNLGAAAAPRAATRLELAIALFRDNTRTDPTFGFFYPVQAGDTLPGIVKRLFDTIGGASIEQRLHYIHCLSSGRWNAGRYGTPSTSKRFGKDLLAPGTGLGLRVAFSTRNEDVPAAIARGRMPQMSVDPRTGEPLGDDAALGVLWLLPVDEDAVRRGELPSCAAYTYRDGSSTIDPPPEFFRLLEERESST